MINKKKVIESGLVAVFACIMAIVSATSTHTTEQSGQYIQVAAQAQSQELATKEKLSLNRVTAGIEQDVTEATVSETETPKLVPTELFSETPAAGSETPALETVVSAVPTAEAVSMEATVAETPAAGTEVAELPVAGAAAIEVPELPVAGAAAIGVPEATQGTPTAAEQVAEGTPEADPAAASDTKQQDVESAWANKLMANVEDCLSIRTAADANSELAGKLPKGADADILERGDEWTKIHSGNVEGYVKNEFCVFGADAEALANQLGTTYATALTDGLRVRAQASDADDAKVVDVLAQDNKMKVAVAEQAPEGLVAVQENDSVAYVSAQYVSVEFELGKAISIEEEQAAIKKAQEEKAAAKAKTTQKGSIDASTDDVTLLGALIQCEAGGEPYEGKLAVGAVVMNRVRSGFGGGSISGVIYQSGQFSPAGSGALGNVLSRGVSGSCLSAAQEAIGGSDNTGGAKYFARSGGQGGVQIGNQVFY